MMLLELGAVTFLCSEAVVQPCSQALRILRVVFLTFDVSLSLQSKSSTRFSSSPA